MSCALLTNKNMTTSLPWPSSFTWLHNWPHGASCHCQPGGSQTPMTTPMPFVRPSRKTKREPIARYSGRCRKRKRTQAPARGGLDESQTYCCQLAVPSQANFRSNRRSACYDAAREIQIQLQEQCCLRYKVQHTEEAYGLRCAAAPGPWPPHELPGAQSRSV